MSTGLTVCLTLGFIAFGMSLPRDISRRPSVGTVPTALGRQPHDRKFRILGEIANFDRLRRKIGCVRAEHLVHDVRLRIETDMDYVHVATIGRRQLDMSFAGRHGEDLRNAVATLTRLCVLPFEIDGESIEIDLVFGGAAADPDTGDEVTLIEHAEEALAKAKAADVSPIDDADADAALDASALASDLAMAVERGEFMLHYQPKLSVRRQEITSAEGLIRWNHPERGVVSPGEFIPIAEQTNLIGPITLWTIRRAIEDQKTLASWGHDLRIFINISGQLLGDVSFVRAACTLIRATEVKLGFEITETSVIRDPQSAIAHLQAFADYGIVIAIDDYGAGLSSLAYLKQLPARELKIDRLFVTQLTSSNRDPLIVRSTIDLAHALEMEVVAEGVETHAAMALLSVMGCDIIQGFLISRPIPIYALRTFLENDHLPEMQVGRNLFGLSTARLAG